MCSAGNSTSTTGPMTRATRPVPAAVSPLSAVFSAVAVMCSSLIRCAGVGERVGAADDLADFLGDLGLPCVVRLTGQRLEQITCVVGGRLHGAAAGGQLGGGRLQHGVEDPARPELGDQRVQDLLGPRPGPGL